MSQPSPLFAVRQRALGLADSGDLGQARAVLEHAVELGRANLGEDDPDVLLTAQQLAAVHQRADDPSGARRVLEAAYAAGQWRLGDADPVMLGISFDLGVVAEEMENRHEARRAFGRVAAHGPAALGADHWAVVRARSYLGDAYLTVRTELAAEQDQQQPAAEPRLPHFPAPQQQAPPSQQPALPPLQQAPPGRHPTQLPAPGARQQAARQQALPGQHLAQPSSGMPHLQAAGGQHPVQLPSGVSHQQGETSRYSANGDYFRQPPSALHQQAATSQHPARQAPQLPHQRAPVSSPAVGAGYFEQSRVDVVAAGTGDSSYSRRAPGIFAAVAAGFGVIIAVVALVVVLAERGDDPDSDVPTLSGPAPGDVRMLDYGSSVKLLWTDPANGRASFVITGGRPGEQLRPMGQVGPTTTTFDLRGLNADLDYCFTVVAVYTTSQFSTSPQVCTGRSPGAVRPSPSG